MSTDKIAEKIRKLLALAQSDNEHEAALAASRAQELMLRHNIAPDEVDRPDVAVETVAQDRLGLHHGARVPRWKSALAEGMSRPFLVRVYVAGGKSRDIYIVGRASNREVFKVTFDYLAREIERLSAVAWRRYRRDRPEAARVVGGVRWRRGFHHGAVKTVIERLRSNVQAITTTLTRSDPDAAIVLLSRAKEIEVWMQANLPKLRKGGASKVVATGYAAGREAGHGIRLDPAVPESRRLGSGR